MDSTDFDAAKQAFFDGVAHLEHRRWAEAEAALRRSLQHLPGRPSTLQNLALALLRLGRPAAALAALEPVLAAEPDAADAWAHHAEALLALDRDDGAAASLARLLALAPERHAAWLQRGLALSRLQRMDEALVCYEQLCERQPGHAAAWLHRGQALQALERHDEALPCFERATAADPTLADAWSHRGAMLKDRGQLEDAAHCFRQALAQGADPDVTRYLLASVTGEAAPAQSPPPYVRFLFDSYAGGFDEHLVQVLHYDAPQRLVDGLAAQGWSGFDAALDLGCGTGLCGQALRGAPAVRVGRLDGVDLSPQMLARARARGAYETLFEAELGEHLHATAARYQLVLAADVFIYVGDLAAVFEGVRRVLLPGGVFAFSAEAADDTHDFRLLPSSRYAHSRRYLQALAARHGFSVRQVDEQPLREDQRRPVMGLYVTLQRS
jgi:predicted TPR repeat methyltransferase